MRRGEQIGIFSENIQIVAAHLKRHHQDRSDTANPKIFDSCLIQDAIAGVLRTKRYALHRTA
jgi:hypothetical protein